MSELSIRKAEGTIMYEVFQAGGGSIPKALSGLWTSHAEAAKAISKVTTAIRDKMEKQVKTKAKKARVAKATEGVKANAETETSTTV